MHHSRIVLLFAATLALPFAGCGGSSEPTVEEVDQDVVEQEAQELEASYGEDYPG